MITNALITHLISSPNITIDRIYPLRAKQDTLKPLAIFELARNDRERTFDGPDSCADADIDIDIYGDTIKSAQDFSNEIVDVLQNYRGTMGDYWIDAIRLESEDEGFDASIELYVHSLSLTVAYRDNN